MSHPGHLHERRRHDIGRPGRMATAVTAVAAVAAMAVCTGASASPVRLDDAASPMQRVEPLRVTLNRTLLDAEPPTQASIHFGWVTYRLNTSAFVGRTARIYFVVPALIANLHAHSGLRVDWRGRSQFTAGSARPGERVQVWSGVVRDRLMEEQMELTMNAELAALQGRVGFESYFEIEAR